MADILIRDVPDETLERIDAEADRLGMSRNTYMRRHVLPHAARRRRTTVEDLERAAELSKDLLDPEVMAGAYR